MGEIFRYLDGIQGDIETSTAMEVTHHSRYSIISDASVVYYNVNVETPRQFPDGCYAIKCKLLSN